MSFRFTFAPLLRLRQSIEHQRALQLQETNLKASRARETLAQLERGLSESAQSGATGLGIGSTGAELQFASVCRETLNIFRKELRAEVQKLELRRQEAVNEYHQAYREREILETLRLGQHDIYRQEQLRRQQEQLDATYLLQRWHHRR
jgi:flagellar export protein FliJ